VANYVKQNNAFEQEAAVAHVCPHCGANAQLIPVSTPKFETLVDLAPSEVALGFRCSVCGAPRFGKVRVRALEPDRVVLSSKIVEIERAKERFQLSYLPDKVRTLFSEALDCYSTGHHNAFASLSRRSADASADHFGSTGAGVWQAAYASALETGEIDDSTSDQLHAVLFEDLRSLPVIDSEISAVLIEVMKDILYQIHVRRAKFKAAMRMRRYFAEEEKTKVTTFRRQRGQARSA